MDNQTCLERFAAEVAQTGLLWAVYNIDGGYPTFERASGGRSMPWWSSRDIANKAIVDIGELSGARVIQQTWSNFQDHWVHALLAFDQAICINWARREDLEVPYCPAEVAAAVRRALGGPSNKL